MLVVRARPRRSAQWPFWLLLAAWVCANSPQAAVYGALGWLADARNFSHQHRLMADVAGLLGGEKASESAVVASADTHSTSLPAVPADSVLKRLDLAVQAAGGSPSVTSCSQTRFATLRSMPDGRRTPPLLGPPRVELVA